ncbi:MAG: GNAT family N-acetyltransferase [Kineosporiaceae bacterium]
MSVDVRPARRDDRRHAVRILAGALHADPGWVHVATDPVRRAHVLNAVLTAAVADAGPHADVAERGGRLAGVAVWQPPGRWPMSAARRLRVLPHVLPLLRLGPAGREARRLGDAVDAAFPPEPVAYLQVLGVDPAVQRTGVGRALLAEGLRRADRDRFAAYLETSSATNVAYYRASGFAVLGEPGPLIPGGPVMWRMRREPATRVRPAPPDRVADLAPGKVVPRALGPRNGRERTPFPPR